MNEKPRSAYDVHEREYITLVRDLNESVRAVKHPYFTVGLRDGWHYFGPNAFETREAAEAALNDDTNYG